ncbi:orotate phosphoribosyltransferase [Candidatus Woesearchaeota archaeon]|nr:orotate phosphoribosyltransferase [Candidatus Woesearchaeota archaeon]
MTFDKEGFDKFILENQVVGIKEEPIKLKSGRESYWYANCRVLSDNYGLLNRTAGFVADFIKEKGLEFDYIYGTPDGATKLGVMVNIILGKDNPDLKMVVGRKKPKDYGEPRDRFFVGPVEKGDRVLVVEDVTTTGSSVVEHLDFLKEAGVEIVGIISLFNRLEKRDDGMGVAEYIKKEFEVPYYWLSDGPRILSLAVKQSNLDECTIKKVVDNANEYLIEPIDESGG